MFVKVNTQKMWRNIYVNRWVINDDLAVIIEISRSLLIHWFTNNQHYLYFDNKNKFILSITDTFTLSSKMIFGFFRAINTAQNITTLLFLSVIFLSIGTSSFETKHHPLRSFRRKNSCYCPKNDFWRSKYSEDVKFSLMSHEYRTHLKGKIFYVFYWV